jgi:hypothetical protein
MPKTAVANLFGLYEFTRIRFGLHTIRSTFQGLMDHILRGLPFTFCYLDDIIAASMSKEQPTQYLQQLFQRLHKAVLSLTDVIYKLKGKVPYDLNQ